MKRIISILTIACILLTLIQLPSFAKEDNINYEAAETLKYLGIIEGFGDDLMLDKVLTRAEFVTMLMRVINVEPTSSGIYFEDVGEGHWAAGAIATALELGIVNGYSRTEFRPDGILVFEEAVKMLVSVLGYSPKAEEKGGFPTGYLAVGQEIGLLNDVGGVSGLIMRRHHAASLIFNAIDINVFVKEAYGDEYGYYEGEGQTLLTQKLEVEKSEGIILANDVTSLTNASGVALNKVKIGNTVYSVGNTMASELIGCSVTYYADIVSGSDVAELIYVCESSKNTKVTVDSKNIVSTTSTAKFNYTKDGKSKISYVSISPYADLLYNGVSIGGFTAADLMPAYGTVTLIDNSGDNVADVISVYEYNSIVVGKINKSNYAVYDVGDMTQFVELDPDSKDYSSVIYVDGSRREFKAIKEGGVLSVAKSINTSGRKKHTVHFSDKSVTDVLYSVGDKTVVIGEESYEVTPSAKAKLTNKIGEKVHAYIDVFGNVVNIDENTDNIFQYGYLIDVRRESGLGGKTKARILTEGGAVSIIALAERVSVDDGTPISSDAISGVLALTVRGADYEISSGVPDTDRQGSGVEQVVRYRLNGKGEISEIDTADSNGTGNDTLQRVHKRSDALRRVIGSSMGDTNLDFIMEDDMIVFLIPPKVNKDDYEMYNSMTKSYFVNNGEYDVETYDMTEKGGVRVCLYQSKINNSIAIPHSTRPVLVNNVTLVYENDETMYKIDGYQSGSQVSLYCTDIANITYGGNVLKRGDIFRYALDNTNKVAKIEPLLMGASVSGNTIAPMTAGYGSSSSYFYSSYRIVYGYATYKNNLNFIVETIPGDTVSNIRYPVTLTSGSNRYYIVSGINREIEQVTEDAMDKYIYPRTNCKVALILESGNARDVIVYDID